MSTWLMACEKQWRKEEGKEEEGKGRRKKRKKEEGQWQLIYQHAVDIPITTCSTFVVDHHTPHYLPRIHTQPTPSLTYLDLGGHTHWWGPHTFISWHLQMTPYSPTYGVVLVSMLLILFSNIYFQYWWCVTDTPFSDIIWWLWAIDDHYIVKLLMTYLICRTLIVPDWTWFLDPTLTHRWSLQLSDSPHWWYRWRDLTRIPWWHVDVVTAIAIPWWLTDGSIQWWPVGNDSSIVIIVCGISYRHYIWLLTVVLMTFICWLTDILMMILVLHLFWWWYWWLILPPHSIVKHYAWLTDTVIFQPTLSVDNWLACLWQQPCSSWQPSAFNV